MSIGHYWHLEGFYILVTVYENDQRANFYLKLFKFFPDKHQLN